MLTLQDIERELTDLADDWDDWEGVSPDKLRALARRIAVQIETERLSKAA